MNKLLTVGLIASKKGKFYAVGHIYNTDFRRVDVGNITWVKISESFYNDYKDSDISTDVLLFDLTITGCVGQRAVFSISEDL